MRRGSTDGATGWPAARWPWAGFAGLVAVFLGVLWLSLGATGPTPGGDTSGWAASAAQLHGWRDLLSTQRPPLYPLLIRVLGNANPAIVAVQAGVYVLSWAVLAASLWRRNLLAAAAVFYTGLYSGFAAWTPVLMTESLSISLSVLAFACLVWFLNGVQSALFGFVAFTIARCFLRNFDVLFCLLDIPLLLALTFAGALGWRQCAALSVSLAVCTAFFALFRGYADYTWYFALLSDVGLRILPDPDRLRFFAAHGMPVSKGLLSMSGHWAWENDWRFFKPDLAPFREWLRAHGRSTYMAYLMRHPVETVAMLWQQRDLVFQPAGVPHWYFNPATRFGVPPWPPFGLVYAAAGGGAFGLTIAAARGVLPWPLMPHATAAVLMTLMPVAAAFAAFYADPSDIPRHCLPVLVQAALAVLLMGHVGLRWWHLRARGQALRLQSPRRALQGGLFSGR